MGQSTFSIGSMFGLPKLADLNPIKRVEGFAAHHYPVTLGEDGQHSEFVWQVGPRAPTGRDMLLLAENGGKGYICVGWIPKEAVKAADIRVGDEISATYLATTKQKLSPNEDPVELPLVSTELAIASANPLLRQFVPENMQLLINGEVPCERVDWRMGADPRDVYYPRTCWNLGDNPGDEVAQMVQLAGRVGRGVKLLIFGPAGSSKTMTLFEILRSMARSNDGRPIFYVIGLLGERPEDIGESMRALEKAIYQPDGSFVPGVAGIRTFFCDADFETLPFEMIRIAQLCAGYAQRLIERCAMLPVAERYSVVVSMDSGSRISAAMDFAQQGKGMTRSGGRDPFSELMVNLIHHVGRTVNFPDPETGEDDLIDVTAILTLLGDSTRLSTERLESQAATITYLLPLLSPEQRPAAAHRWPGIYWPMRLVRREELFLPPWELEARQRLRPELYEQDRRTGTSRIKPGAIVAVEKLLDRHGSATAALKSLVSDLRLGEETALARDLVRSGEVARDDLASLKKLQKLLVIPSDWPAITC